VAAERRWDPGRDTAPPASCGMPEPARNPPVPRHKGSISEHMILATAEVHVFRPPRKREPLPP